MLPLSRRQLLALGGALAIPLPRRTSRSVDPVADVYRRVLHLHTRWMEQQWNPEIGAYRAEDFRFVGVLGNVVLLRMPDFDAKLAGVDRDTLQERTLATIGRFAGTNRLAGGKDWGKALFWDSTSELFLVLAARLAWADLDERTRTKITQIAAGQAAYAYGLAFGDDPLSPGWSPNGSSGAWTGDSKLEEMGVYAQAIAPGLAWGQDDAALRGRFNFWAANLGGLPAADLANLSRQGGVPVRDRNRAHNILDTFVVENHDSVNPHYQAEMWRIAGRAAIHFEAAGKPIPDVLRHPPNGVQLWRTLRMLASDAGEPVMPMTPDRYHLYGRDVLPLAYLAQVTGDRDAARAEADLAARLEPYLRYAPGWRLSKFSGDESHEPWARAELAIAYLFHVNRKSPTKPVSSAEFFARASGTQTFGGFTAHQSSNAFAAAVTQTGFVNFLWQPRHDNWLVDTRAAAFLPSSSRVPTDVSTVAYSKIRDGFDATATMLAFGEQFAGYATLPTGTVVYASTGIGTDEGTLSLFNLDMPGIPGLDGRRTFTSATGSITLDGQAGGGGDGGIDELHFEPRPARYVRMQGREAANQFGYSLWTFSVLDEAGADIAQGALAGASSSHESFPAYNATDGNPKTRWAVDTTQLSRQDGWFAVDLQSEVTVAGVRLLWEGAYATRYVIQTSPDAVTWTDVVSVPDAHELSGCWVDIDGRAGLITYGTDRPISVSATGLIAATGHEASPTLFEGYARAGVDLATLSMRRMPDSPPGLRASDADGYLSVFNLTEDPIAGAMVTLASKQRLYRGVQVVHTDGLAWYVTQPAGTGRVESPRFEVLGDAPIGTRFTVPDSRHVTVTAPASHGVSIALRSGSWLSRVRVSAGKSKTVTAPGGPITPTADLARGRTTFPTSPIPAGMTSPARAVDANPRTAWRPGAAGRMVVDLGDTEALTLARLTWSPGRRRPIRLERSIDGISFTTVARVARPSRTTEVQFKGTARYVAVMVDDWEPGGAELIELSLF